MALVIAGGMVVFALAPPAFLLLPTKPDTTLPNLGFMANHFGAYATGGLAYRSAPEGESHYGWMHSASIEALWNRLYGEARFEAFDVADHVQFWTVGAGYLFQPLPNMAGGFTLGYRWAHGDDVQDAVEVGLPLVWGREVAAGRFEPTYVISSRGVSWNYRLRLDLDIGRSPFVAGTCFDIKPLRQGGGYHATFTLLLGVRARR